MSDPISALENFFDDREKKEKELDIKLDGGPLFW